MATRQSLKSREDALSCISPRELFDGAHSPVNGKEVVGKPA